MYCSLAFRVRTLNSIQLSAALYLIISRDTCWRSSQKIDLILSGVDQSAMQSFHTI